MKKFTVLLTVLMVLIASLAFGAPVNGVSGQVVCNGTATQLYAGTSTATDVSNLAVWLTVITPSVNVYVGPSSSVTTANAGIILSSTGIQGMIVEHKKSSLWCITSGSSATVGYTIFY